MAQENQKPSLQYLRSRYNKFYKEGNIKKARLYNDAAIGYYGFDIEQAYHARLAKKLQRNPFGIKRFKKIRYGKG